MTQEILTALRNIEDKIMSTEALDKAIEEVMKERDTFHDWADKLARAIGGDEIGEHSNMNNPWANALEMAENGMPFKEPTAFDWTPSMQAIWPKDMRPTMSGLLAIWEAMHEAAVYGEASTSPKPLASQPPYPEGNIVGPCVCGSWPGGECMKCEWRRGAEPMADAEGWIANKNLAKPEWLKPSTMIDVVMRWSETPVHNIRADAIRWDECFNSTVIRWRLA